MNILIQIAIAWLVCQLIKMGLRRNLSVFWTVGGMPSAHSALVGALAVSVALQQGFASALAAVSYVILAIVVHDALHIRKHHSLREILVGLGVGIIVVSFLYYL